VTEETAEPADQILGEQDQFLIDGDTGPMPGGQMAAGGPEPLWRPRGRRLAPALIPIHRRREEHRKVCSMAPRWPATQTAWRVSSRLPTRCRRSPRSTVPYRIRSCGSSCAGPRSRSGTGSELCRRVFRVATSVATWPPAAAKRRGRDSRCCGHDLQRSTACGGEGGIRTLEGLLPTRFPVARHKPG
jgi:hypothetical protein